MLIRILLLGCLLLGLGQAAAATPSSVTIELPPASLAQWYKPQNKRQEWLHTMFRLRRSMQALEEYAQAGNTAAMEKWAQRLRDDYEKIGEMVPEWEEETRPALLPELLTFIEAGDAGRAQKALRMINRTCTDCHQRYQAQAAVLYRAPDYERIEIPAGTQQSLSFHDAMEALSTSVNRILIAIEDDNYPVALQSRGVLIEQLDGLGQSCATCHQDEAPRARILGATTSGQLEQLQHHLQQRDPKGARKVMGEFAVGVCARCHGTHRTLSDLREKMIKAGTSN